jgi:hypothetical protein
LAEAVLCLRARDGEKGRKKMTGVVTEKIGGILGVLRGLGRGPSDLGRWEEFVKRAKIEGDFWGKRVEVGGRKRRVSA